MLGYKLIKFNRMAPLPDFPLYIMAPPLVRAYRYNLKMCSLSDRTCVVVVIRLAAYARDPGSIPGEFTFEILYFQVKACSPFGSN